MKKAPLLLQISCISLEQTVLYRRWQTEQRYYIATLEKNLFGEWEVRKYWGGRGTRLGGKQTLPVPTYEEGKQHMQKVEKERKQRGYTLCL